MKKGLFRVLLLGLLLSIIALFAIPLPASAQSITLSTTSGSVQTTVSVVGSGFTASAAFQIYFAYGTSYQATVGTGTISSTGTLSTYFSVPSVPAGSYIVRIQTSTNNAVAYFTVNSAINLNTFSVVVGNQVSISGTGFSALRNVTILFDNVQVATSSTNTSGIFSTSFLVPESSAGSHTITVNDGIYSKTATLTVTSSMTISPTSGIVGTNITISGTGFRAGRAITIKFDNTQISTSNINSVGSFSTSFSVPETHAGSHTISVTDGTNTKIATLSVVPSMAISPTSGIGGTTIDISGNGFGASRSIKISFDGSNIATVPSTITTNNIGNFSGKFTVPAGPARTVQVSASDGTNSASTPYKLNATVGMTPTTGKVGTPVTIEGSGFNASRPVTITFDNEYVNQVSTDTLGKFTASFNVPAATGGQHPVTANDGVRSVSETFTVANNMVMTPNSGKVGTPVTITGSGFRGSRTVNIYFDSIVIATAFSDNNGSFSATFNTVAGTGGTHTISVNDGAYTASDNFVILPGISLSQTSGKMGSQVSVTGTGFDSSRTLAVKLGTMQVGAMTTDANGSFSYAFTIPQLETGSYNVNVSDGNNVASDTFTVTTSFNITPTTGYVGSTVTVKGSGYNGLVTIKYDNSAVATATASADGSFSTTFVVPTSIHGDHIVTVIDTSTTLQTKFSMESFAPSAPVLVTPQGVSKENSRPTLTWQGVYDQSRVIYNLQISSDSNFSTIILEKKDLTTTQYDVADTEKLKATGKETPYYWRVKAVDLASNEGQWSPSGSFYVSFMADWVKYTLISLGALIGALIIFWLGMITGKRGWRKETS